MKESYFQRRLIKHLRERFNGCYIHKMDSSYTQGVPDLLILYNDKWAMLEVKRSTNAKHRPNQDYYIDKFNSMSFARFVSPENEEEILDAMEKSFRGE